MPSPAPKPELVVTTPKGPRRIALKGRASWTLGRGTENDIVIADHLISRRHALLQLMAGGEFILVDLGSRNGTFVNHRRVSIPVQLRDGDQLSIGPIKATFVAPTPATPAPGPAQQDLVVAQGELTANMSERRMLTVLVVDVRQYTRLSRTIDEARLANLIGTWFSHTGDILSHYGSSIDKYIGDAIMAVWDHESDRILQRETINIFRALHAINRLVANLNNEFELPFPMQVGAGINTGYAMIGNAGDGQRPEYTALGDTVNTAFRLESATRAFECDIAIGAMTYDALRLLTPEVELPFQYRRVKVKGHDQEIGAHVGNFGDLSTIVSPFRTIAAATC